MKEFIIKNIAGLDKAAEHISGLLKDTPLCLFYGEMGSGKTTLISEICRQMKLEGNISSPTFTIINEYKGRDGTPSYHIDLYRLKSMKEASGIGIEDYIFSGRICLVEWPELIEGITDIPHLRVHIVSENDGSRVISILKKEI